MKDSWIRRLPFFILFILLILGMVWAVCYCINDVYGDRPVVNVTNKIIDGDQTIHGQVYEVMVMDGVNRELVNDSLKLVSNQYGFVIVPYDPDRVYPDPWPNVYPAPFPKEDESFLIVMAARDDYPTVPAAGWTRPPTGRITVLVDKGYPASVLAAIIEHECTHNIEKTNKLDYPDNPGNMLEMEVWMDRCWLGSTWHPSDNLWNLMRNRWQISEYLDNGNGNDADHAEPASGA